MISSHLEIAKVYYKTIKCHYQRKTSDNFKSNQIKHQKIMAESEQKSNTTSPKRRKQLAVSEGSQGKQRKINQLWRSRKTGRATNSKASGRPIEINDFHDSSDEGLE